ncbi:MAG: autotransporter-associated beta strand repeat-containing protein, partial [Kiritimatiellaeota bacterium]|nr:autotransporter-associated beta strand repeat-containing protein [Kiritimatiellota bacterium]
YATIGTNILSLGAGLTALNVDSIFVSGGKSSGLINFAGPTGMLTISNSTGTGRADLNIGFINAGTGANQTGIFDTRGHEADLFLGNVVCGERSSGSGGSGISGGYLFFNQGTMDITNLIIGLRVTTLSSNVIGEVHISGGTVNLKSTMLASNSASGASVTALLDLSGGLITMSDNITKGGGVGSATATLLMTGNAVLDMSGKYIGTAANPIDTLTFQSGTLKNVGDINGGAGLAKTGSGSLILAGNNTYGGGTTINGGTLQLGNDNALPNGSDLFVSSSGSFDLAAFGQTVGNLTGTGAVTNSAGAGLGALTVSAGDFSGAISGANSLTKIGAGALTLSGQSTYSGDTTINNGTLKMGADLALPSTTQLKADVLGSTLDLAGYSQQIRSLDTFAGTIANSAVSRSTLTVQFGEGIQNFLGQVTGASTLTLTGGGTLQVSNSASFGPFTASIVTNNSVLIMNGTHSGLVTTYSNSWVGGSGTITTLTNMVGGLYAPGATLGLGSQTIHNLTLTPGSLLAVGLAASSNGLARVDTTFVASNALLRLDLTHYTFTPNQIYVVMDYSGTSFSVTDQSQLFTLQDFGPSAQASILLTNNMTFAVSGGLSTTNFFQINYDTLANGLPGSQITLTAVPEPGTASLLGLVGVAWLIRRIRRKKNI